MHRFALVLSTILAAAAGIPKASAVELSPAAEQAMERLVGCHISYIEEFDDGVSDAASIADAAQANCSSEMDELAQALAPGKESRHAELKRAFTDFTKPKIVSGVLKNRAKARSGAK